MLQRWIFLILLILGVGVLSWAVASADDPPHRIGLIIIGPDGDTRTACIMPEQETPTGFDVLQASGLEINAMVGPMGAAICAVDDVGCFYPAETCFCQCEGGKCDYWAYYIRELEDEDWRYSGIGTSGRPVEDGFVELWIWRTDENEDDPLPDISWDNICGTTSESQPIEREAQAQNSSIVGYIAFGIIASTVLAGVIWQRRRIQ